MWFNVMCDDAVSRWYVSPPSRLARALPCVMHAPLLSISNISSHRIQLLLPLSPLLPEIPEINHSRKMIKITCRQRQRVTKKLRHPPTTSPRPAHLWVWMHVVTWSQSAVKSSRDRRIGLNLPHPHPLSGHPHHETAWTPLAQIWIPVWLSHP